MKMLVLNKEQAAVLAEKCHEVVNVLENVSLPLSVLILETVKQGYFNEGMNGIKEIMDEQRNCEVSNLSTL